MPTADDNLATLQRYVDGYAADVGAIQGALFTGDMPDEARRILVGALNYVLDALDMFPDHYKGLGIADDAVVLRLGAAQAVAKGAKNARLERLAADASDVRTLFPELYAPLERFVVALADRTVRGRSADQILKDKDARVVFSADLARELKRHQAAPIDPGPLGAEGACKELDKMMRHTLKRTGHLS